MSSCPMDADPARKKEKREEWQAGKLTRFTDLLESRIAGGTSVVKTPSVADLAVAALVDGFQKGMYDHVDSTFFESYAGIT